MILTKASFCPVSLLKLKQSRKTANMQNSAWPIYLVGVKAMSDPSVKAAWGQQVCGMSLYLGEP